MEGIIREIELKRISIKCRREGFPQTLAHTHTNADYYFLIVVARFDQDRRRPITHYTNCDALIWLGQVVVPHKNSQRI